MTEKVSLLGRKTYKVTDKVTINIPTVGMTRGQNDEEENDFWSEVSLFTITPDDMLLDLDKLNIDFTKMSDYSLFVFLFSMQREEKISKSANDLLFVGFNLWQLELRQSGESFVLVDETDEIVIDEGVYNKLSDLITFITGHEKPKRLKFVSEGTRQSWLRKERRKREIEIEKAKRAKKKSRSSSGGVLDGIILRLVCNANFPYDFETINNVTLFDLIYSLKQIEKDASVTDLMQSRLVGVDLKKFSNEQLSRYVL